MFENVNWKDLAKYFIHGIAFSLIMLVMSFVWAVLLVVLVAVGLFIGLIIGFILLFFIIGGLNSFLTDWIWSVPVKTAWTSLLGHGIALSILLVIVNIPNMLIALFIPGLSTMIVLSIVDAFIDGVIAKKVAGWWKEEYRKETVGTKRLYPTITCPSCKKKIAERYHQCPWCGTELPSTHIEEEKLPRVRLPKKNIECPRCGREVFSDLKICPYCGWELSIS